MKAKKNILLTTSAAPMQSPFSTAEKRPPLGLGYLVSTLRRAGHNVFFIDNYLKPDNFIEEDYLRNYRIDYVGIYTNTICYRDTLRMLYKIDYQRRSGLWNGKIMVGGPHTTVALETIPHFVDHVVQGEGEQAILDIVEGVAQARVLRYPRINDLDSLPMPAWDDFVKLPYNWGVQWFNEKPVFTMTTSRGCPFNCAFCSVGAVWGKKYTYFSAQRVTSEIEHLIEKYGAKGIYFREDNFTLNRKRVVEFCNLLLERNIRIYWVCESRVDNLDKNLLELMYSAGARGFYFGVESGSQRILDSLNKGITVTQIKNTFKMCQEIGFKTAASIVVGLPQETEEDLLATENLLCDIRPSITWKNVFVGIPNSPLYKYVVDNNLYEFIDDRGLVYLKEHNKRAQHFYQKSWDAEIPFDFGNPDVSVIVAVHNASRYIRAAIKSVLTQTYQNFELIVVDDASTDDTAAILAQLTDPRIRVIKNPENLGPAGARNKALQIAKGRLIAIMDADDISLPHRFETQMQFLQKNPDYALVGSYAYQIDELGQYQQIIKLQTDDQAIRKSLLEGNNFVHGSVMIRRNVILEAGGYDEKYKYAHDYELWLRIAERHKVSNLPEALYCWRTSVTQISHAKKDEQDYYATLARRKARKRFANQITVQKLRSKPMVSVIVPTYNRPDLLNRVLVGFQQQTLDKNLFEIIVTDDGSNPPVNEVIEQHVSSLRINYRYQENQGLSAARNESIKRANADLLVLHDDDDLPSPDYLERSVQFHQKYTDEEDILLARVMPHPELYRTPLLKWIYEDSIYFIRFPDKAQVCNFWKFFGGTSCCKKSIFRFGLYDPIFRFGFEDMELAYRLNQHLNLRVHFDPETVSYCLRAPRFEDMVIRSYREGLSLRRFYELHGAVLGQVTGKEIFESRQIVGRLDPFIQEVIQNTLLLERTVRSVTKSSNAETLPRDAREEILIKGYEFATRYGKARGWLDYETKRSVDEGQKDLKKLFLEKQKKPKVESSSVCNHGGISNNSRVGRALVFYPHNPFPARTGSHKRCLMMVQLLKDLGYDVHFFSSTFFSDTPWTPRTEKQIRENLGVDVTIYSAGSEEKWSFQNANRENQEENCFEKYRIQGMSLAFEEKVRSYRPDVILINYAMWGHLIAHVPDEIITVMDMHDLVTRNDKMQKKAWTHLGKPPFISVHPPLNENFFSGDNLSAHTREFAIYDQFDIILAIAQREENIVKTNTSHCEVELFPMGFKPVRIENRYDGAPLFLVSANVFNFQGYIFMTQSILPEVIKHIPDFNISVVGDACRYLSNARGVTLEGFQDDLTGFYAHAPYAICPLIGGTGQQVKIVEAMAHGVPVVAMREIAESSPIEHGVNGFVADNAESFARLMRLCHERRDICREMGKHAQETIISMYSKDELQKRLADILKNARDRKSKKIPAANIRYNHRTPSGEVPKRVLMMRTDSIGDNILASGSLKYLRQHFPGSHISILCQNHVAELYEQCPYTDSILTFNRAKFINDEEYREQLIRKISSVPIDLLINGIYSREMVSDLLAISIKAAQKVAFADDCSNISRELLEQHNRHYTQLISNADTRCSEIDHHRLLMQHLGIETNGMMPTIWLSENDEKFAEQIFAQFGIPDKGAIAMFAGAQQEMRRCYQLGASLKRLRQEMDLHLITLGGIADLNANQHNLNDAGVKGIDLSGKTTLRQAAAIIRKCAFSLGSETGLSHASCAVGTTNITLVGGGHFGRFLPYSASSSVVSLPLDCYGCNWKCQHQTPYCTRGVKPDVLEKAVLRSIQEPSSRPRAWLQAASVLDVREFGVTWRDCGSLLDPERVAVNVLD